MTAAALSNELRGILTRAGIDDPAGDSSLIIENVLGCTRAQLVARRFDEVSDEQAAEAAAMARRRAKGEPIQYVLSVWPFMGRDYAVGEGVLIPRDDTEVVVRAALDMARDIPSPTVTDLCSGSGIIAITLASQLTGADVFAVEKSAEAYGYLLKNIGLNNADIKPIHADLCVCLDSFKDGSLDMIISNPPYIKSDEIDGLQREISCEPRLALDGGESGYDFYELIIRLWTPKLKKGGAIALELGEGQYEYVAGLLRQNGYTDINGHLDIQGTIRAVTAKKASP